ncbi:MAG: DUF5317 domain-containing protein [Patescibacteria group bacterium]|nr:DUF5317 domain-containing protein [Patescibacteria group bacterium]
MNIIPKIRWLLSHTFRINSRLGSISLNIAAIAIMGVILSINANVIVKAANDGKMPVIVETGYDYNVTEHHVVANDTTNLRFLGDWITINQKGTFMERDTPFIKFASKLLNFPPGKNIVASPGDVGMWIFLITSIFASLLSFICSFWHYAKKIPVK